MPFCDGLGAWYWHVVAEGGWHGCKGDRRQGMKQRDHTGGARWGLGANFCNAVWGRERAINLAVARGPKRITTQSEKHGHN